MFALHHHNRMIVPSMPLSDASSDILLRSLPQQKFTPRHVYLRQQHTVQVIELVEGPPPPPRRITSVINDSSVAASSSCDDSSSEDSASQLSTEEPSCSSYCSSDIPPEHLESSQSHEQTRAESSTETYSVRMKRILAWRENFSSSIGATFSEPHLPSSLKRKLACDEEDDDNVSHTSKRSRSQASQGAASAVSLGMHSCPACDASFFTQQSLRQHGLDAKANEACSVAVEYAFE
ncbi:uncharacterized protein LACBIDRAFT_303561 [Laccaria bicolor S238N-H82]|uniref:Predicted protein n=1 Tax=Laccaria bicolor (strain S238N-H82 / ATCC MYA-4686) TaxID=486041 RepID=B0DJQ6_LACBS|nr:uncharacterized protein LACBIDRAFT_303561 [Laccaria bicolor S238N-H82]EDR05251.1 predicted protein [Laccaria bicolor S238N-H82]|eukprot:XP_001884216.1 predicted protein [Laccaria bicolor S238N-H82]